MAEPGDVQVVARISTATTFATPANNNEQTFPTENIPMPEPATSYPHDDGDRRCTEI